MFDDDELTIYGELKGLELPELGGKRIIDVSRLYMISALESAITKHYEGDAPMSRENVKVADNCLHLAYMRMDGILDDVPLRFACAQKTIQNVQPDMLACYLSERPQQKMASWGSSLDETLVQKFLCYWTCLNYLELVVGHGTGILLIPKSGNDGFEHHFFELPKWINELEEYVRQSHPITVGELSAAVSELVN